MESSARSIIVFCLLTVVHMASLCYYSPFPPRAWSRVQHPCTFASETAEQMEAAQMLRKPMDAQMLRKGNVLQHKGNSARLTKTQRYAQLARGGGPNRTKVFATQTQTYSNPNTRMMQRMGAEVYPYPNNVVGAPNNPSGPFEVNASSPFDCSNNTLLDGGSLVCGTLVDPCTGEVLKSNEASPWMCSPASASNVPGASLLCWDSRIQSWFPREKKVMSNSGTKWPTNYKGFQTADNGLLSSALYSASIAPPYIMLLSFTDEYVYFQYNHNNLFNVDGYNVYVNDTFFTFIPFGSVKTHNMSLSVNELDSVATLQTTEKSGSGFNNYKIHMTVVRSGQESDNSNQIILQQQPIPTPVLPPEDPSGNSSCDSVKEMLSDMSNNVMQMLQSQQILLNEIQRVGENASENRNIAGENRNILNSLLQSVTDVSNNVVEHMNNFRTEVKTSSEYLKTTMTSTNEMLNALNDSSEELKMTIDTSTGSLRNAINQVQTDISSFTIDMQTMSTTVSSIEMKLVDATASIRNDIHTLELHTDANSTTLDTLSAQLSNYSNTTTTEISSLRNDVHAVQSNIQTNIQQLAIDVAQTNGVIIEKLNAFNDSLLDVVSKSTSILNRILAFKECCCTSNCDCSFYDSIFTNHAIVQINAYVMQFIATANDETTFTIDFDEYNLLRVQLEDLRELFAQDPSGCFGNIVDIYDNMLHVVKHAFEDKMLRMTIETSAEKWKQDSIILNDRNKLEEYLRALNNNFALLSMTITSEKAMLKPQYMLYHKRFGVPPHLEYDPKKMKRILIELGLFDEMDPIIT